MGKYAIGQVIELVSDKDTVVINGQTFLSLNSARTLSRNQYPLLSALYQRYNIYGFAFGLNPNWPFEHQYGMSETDSALRGTEYTSNIVSNRLSGSGNQYVAIRNTNTEILYGNESGPMNVAPVPNATLYSAVYRPQDGKWHFGGGSGQYLQADDSNMAAGLTAINNLPDGFTSTVNLMFCASNGDLYVGCGTNELARSTDGGASWTDLGATVYTPYHMVEDDSGNFVLTVSSGRIHTSNDGGNTWPLLVGASWTNYGMDRNPNTGVIMLATTYGVKRTTVYNSVPTATSMTANLRRIRWCGSNTWIVTHSTITSENAPLLSYTIDDGDTWTDVSQRDMNMHGYNQGIRGLEWNGIDRVVVTDAYSGNANVSYVPDPTTEVLQIPRRYHEIPGYNYYVCAR